MKKILFVIFLIFSLSFLACGSDGLTLSDPSEQSPYEKQNKKEENAPAASSFDAKEKCYAYLCGAVANEGIYEFTPGTRLFELVEEAGGLDEEADTSAVNLAVEVKDGERVRIPFIGESLIEEEDDLIDLNKADVKDLCSIPGIGESRANAIIEYRESVGGFSDIEELKNIPGIKDATFQKIKPYVCVR